MTFEQSCGRNASATTTRRLSSLLWTFGYRCRMWASFFGQKRAYRCFQNSVENVDRTVWNRDFSHTTANVLILVF